MGKGKGKQSAKSTKERLPRRFGWQDQQEAESKADFAKRLAKLGWNVMQPEKDLGEDYLVQIYDDGVSSGLSFYVQLKSIKGAEKRKGKRTPDELRYPLEVKDIEHWEVQSPPVVLFVWDLDKQAGYWETIARIVEALEKKGKAWREKKSVTVKVPVENGTDEEGMRRLRKVIVQSLDAYIFPEGRTEIEICFPATEEGAAAMQVLESALAEGTSTTVEGKFITDFKIPKLHRLRYGLTGRPERLDVTPVAAEKQSITVRVEVESDEGGASLPYIELRTIQPGLRRRVLSNEHQQLPLIVRLEVDADKRAAGVSVKRKRAGRTVFEEREALGFLRAFSTGGNTLRIVICNDESKVLLTTKLSSTIESNARSRLDQLYEIVDKLCVIQRRVQRIHPTPAFKIDKEISADDLGTILDIFPIIAEGREERTINWRLAVDPAKSNDGEQYTRSDRIAIYGDGGHVSLLGADIELGPVVITPKTPNEATRFVKAYRAAFATSRDAGAHADVNIDQLKVVVEYLHWLPRSQQGEELHRLAVTQAGYFSGLQAQGAGYASVDTLKAEERIDECGGNIFRLRDYPASDREDLVVTWLQTEKQGVFSHDTALALHELSDILPVRQHITLPPGWKPVEGMALSANTVVHCGTVEFTETSWMGPVPFTKPLRTLVDCIDDVLPPDILDQALSDAYGRGMLSPAELHALQARKAKSA